MREGLRTMLWMAVGLTLAVRVEAQTEFERSFVDKTMRVDYFHTGGMGTEIVSLDRIVSAPTLQR